MHRKATTQRAGRSRGTKSIPALSANRKTYSARSAKARKPRSQRRIQFFPSSQRLYPKEPVRINVKIPNVRKKRSRGVEDDYFDRSRVEAPDYRDQHEEFQLQSIRYALWNQSKPGSKAQTSPLANSNKHAKCQNTNKRSIPSTNFLKTKNAQKVPECE